MVHEVFRYFYLGNYDEVKIPVEKRAVRLDKSLETRHMPRTIVNFKKM